MIQIAEFCGVTGLSFAVAFGNIIAVTTPIRLFLEAKTHRVRPHFDLTITLVGIVALLSFGLGRMTTPVASTKSIRVAAVQTNIPQLQKFDAQFAPQVFDKFRRLSELAVKTNPPPDLLVWPESSMPDPARDPTSASYRFVTDFAASTKTDLMLGSLDFDEDRDYNAALLISKGGEQVQVYRKIHLVPFGEYIPLRKSFPLFAAIASTWVPGDFARGTEHTVFGLTNPDVRVAPLICFEDTVGDLVRHFVSNGANLLVDITNDGWFLHSSGSQQHLANAKFRCVENRRPMVRAANTGVTCFVSQFGRVIDYLRDDNGETFGEGMFTGEVAVPQDRQLTFYTRHGEWLAESCAIVTAVSVIFIFVRRKVAR
jgi:apolipoprotein N-acyltransferase